MKKTTPPIGSAKRRLFTIVLVALVVGAAENLARHMMSERLNTGRHILLGREKIQVARKQHTVGQPYLLYINAPNFSNDKGLQHNEDGYRGKAVTLDRQPGIYRILCLGGSTTYGYTVGRWQQAYPAVLEELLNTQPPPGYTGVEVINGGLPWATTAEMLTHYHFKFHYYQPDLVILNEGLNDAEAYTRSFYHPDYSHWRQPLINLRPLPPAWRWMAHSRLLSLFILNVFYADQMTGGEFVIKDGALPTAPWFKPGGQLLGKNMAQPDNHLAFTHNLGTLIRDIQSDGARCLLVPLRLAPGEIKDRPFLTSQVLRHEQLMQQLAGKFGTGYAPFPASTISGGNWADYCHLNPGGEREKAAHIAEHVRRLWPQPTP